MTLGLDSIGNINTGGVQSESGFGGVRPCLSCWRGAKRFSINTSNSDGVIQSLVLVEEEIHVWRLDLGLVGLFQVRVAAGFDLLDVIGVIEVTDQLVRPQLIGLLCHYDTCLKGNPMFLLFEQRGLRGNMDRAFDLSGSGSGFSRVLRVRVGRLAIRMGWWRRRVCLVLWFDCNVHFL